jgi:phosphomannomutase
VRSGQQGGYGRIFDTDVDRAGAVAADGKEINRNRLIALIAAVLLEEHPGTTIVTDSITSSGLAAFIAAQGGVHHRFKRGYKNVIDEAIRINQSGRDCQLAIETSGHGALKENYFLDDGAYLISKLLIKMAQLIKEGRTLFSLIDSLAERAESTEVRMNLPARTVRHTATASCAISALTPFRRVGTWQRKTTKACVFRLARAKGTLVPLAHVAARPPHAAEYREQLHRRRARHCAKALFVPLALRQAGYERA